VCVSGEERHTRVARAGDDQFEREVPVVVPGAGQVQPGPAGEREATAAGHAAAQLVASARSVRLGRAPVRQPGAPQQQRAPSRVPVPSTVRAAVPAAPQPPPAVVAATAVAVPSRVVDGEHGGRGRADGRVGRGRVRTVRQDAPAAGHRMARRERPRGRDGLRRTVLDVVVVVIVVVAAVAAVFVVGCGGGGGNDCTVLVVIVATTRRRTAARDR